MVLVRAVVAELSSATKRKDPTMILVFCPTLKAGMEDEDVGVEVYVRESARELDPLQQPLWHPWDAEQYSRVLPQYLNKYDQSLSLDMVDTTQMC